MVFTNILYYKNTALYLLFHLMFYLLYIFSYLLFFSCVLIDANLALLLLAHHVLREHLRDGRDRLYKKLMKIRALI